ncbi:MAG: hypothetical protein KME26_19175 [Oscillatoria princeps RMCB-10]|jgi:WD40 repeat protein|nr:hypothetical protein [Oscillatoria princeps RMCB-10]
MSLKSDLLRFLSQRILNTQTVPQRKALLNVLGFDRFIRQINWGEGTDLVFFSELLDLLCYEGKESLVTFLKALADRNLNLVGLEYIQKLNEFADSIQALNPNDWNQEFRGFSDDEEGIKPISEPQTHRPESEKCPYKGLFAFQREDAQFFFGRERFTEAAIDSLRNQPFLAIIGNSGIGKSSVVFAGLIPELSKLGNWHFLTFRPKNSPFRQLAEELVSFLNPALTKDEPQFIQEQANYGEGLKNKELKLTDILSDECKKNNPNQYLLIVVDQFEELYTLCLPDERNLFIENLLEVIDSQKDKKNPDVVIAITLRVDFYGFGLDYQPLAELLQKYKPETLIGMSRKELELAIEKPAEVVGLTIQNGLTKIILDEVTNNPGELPLLEFALEELWKQRREGQLTIAAYHQIGGIEKALANYAESVYKKFAKKQLQIKHIFTQLVRFGKQTENTRRLATYEQIGQDNWKLVTQLADNRLVVTGQNAHQPTAEVVHEALIRGWERLQEWMEEDQDFRQWQDRLRSEIDIWKETGRSNSALLRGALLVEAENWFNEKPEGITDAQEIEFVKASRQLQEQENIERIKELVNLSEKELQLKQKLSSLVIAVKASIKLSDIQEPSEGLKRNVTERLQQGYHEISEENQLIGHKAEVNGVSFSPDGSMIASASDDQTVKLWNLNGKLLNTLKGHSDQIWIISFSPDSQIIASASLDKTVKLWSSNGVLLKTIEGHTDQVLGVCFSPNGRVVASGSADRTVRMWSVDGTLLNTLEGHTDQVFGVSFSPDGQIIASGSADRTVKLWSADGSLLKTLEGHSDRLWGVNFSPDGQILASASVDRTIKLWSVDGTLLNTLEGHTDQVFGVSFSPDGQTIASGSVDRTIKLWSVDGTLLNTLEGHTDQVFGVSFSPDGQTIASGSADRTVRLWRIVGIRTRTLEGHSDQVLGVSFSPDGQILASASVDRTVRLWSVDGTLLNTLEGHLDRLWGVSFSPDGTIIASASADRTIRLWSADGTLLKILEGHSDQVLSISFSPDGQILASGGVDRTIRLWSVNGKLLNTLEGHSDQILSVSFSPDGQVIASAGADKTIRLWFIDGTLWKIVEGNLNRIWGVSFSPDSRFIASAHADGTVRLWSIDGRLLKILEGHSDQVLEVSFSPNSQFIVSTSADRTIRLWSIDGILLRTLEGHSASIWGVEFSPNSQTIASASTDRTIKLWSIDSEDLSLDLDTKFKNLLKKSCSWVRNYLMTNPGISENDRNLCNDYY